MEGNLTRARSSLYITPSGVMSSIHSSSPLSRSTPSPQNDPRILPQLGVPPVKHRQMRAAVEINSSSPGHSRAYSENSIASSVQSAPFSTQSTSTSAQYIDRRRTEGSRSSPPSNKSKDFAPDEARLSGISSSLGKSSPPHGVYLEPLNEDKVVPEFEVDHASIRSGLDEEFLDSSGEPRNLTRSTSSLQMRDLRDQMHDLKGRLSVLRDRARDDTMKRRSLQSLRTPSPFTAAEQWYIGDKNYVAPGLSTNAGIGHSSLEGKTEMTNHLLDDGLLTAGKDTTAKAPEHATSETGSIYEEASEDHHAIDNPTKSGELEILKGDETYETTAEDDEHEESVVDVDNDYDDEIASHDELDAYESDASIYHDATSISHEDREDAFDYEHFFLHSAMGTINQQRLERRGSFSSEDSVETTRGPQAAIVDRKAENSKHGSLSLSLLRSESVASVSTMDTFATATEGLDSEVDDQEDQYNYAVQEAVALPVRSVTPDAVKRSTFGPSRRESQNGEKSPTERPSSAIYNPEERDGKNIHRPSVASFDSFKSTGTTRSFPLVNKSKSQISLNPTAILEYLPGPRNGSATNGERFQVSPVQMLPREEQLLVEKLVASLGKCVLGLQEASAGSYEGRQWRRRLDEARKVLDGE
jgi:hypothetical protein